VNKIETFKRDAEKIRMALYEMGIDVFAHYCMDFAVGLGDAVEPDKEHTIRCSWVNKDYDYYSHCGLIWNGHFCDGHGCIPIRDEQKINDKFYEYMFGVPEKKSKWKVAIKEFKHTELEHFLEHPTVENIAKTVRDML